MVIKNDTSPFNYTWHVPITFKTDSMKYSTDKSIMMSKKEMVLTLPKPFEWIKLNSEGRHLYVTHYSDSYLEKIMEVVKESARDPPKEILDHRDRGHVICDIFNSAQVKLVPYSAAFEAAKYLKEEKHYLPWTLSYTYFKNIRSMIDESLADCYRKYIVHLLLPQYKEVMAAKTTLVEQLKFEIFTKFARYIKSERTSHVFDSESLSEQIAKYKAATPEQRAGLDLLVLTTDPDQVELIGNTVVRYPSTAVSIIVNFIARYSNNAPVAVWHVYRDNYKVYNDKYGLAQFEYARSLKNMIRHQREGKIISEIEEFFRTHTAGAGHLGVLNGLEEAKFVSKFKQDSEPELKRYLESQSFCRDL